MCASCGSSPLELVGEWVKKCHVRSRMVKTPLKNSAFFFCGGKRCFLTSVSYCLIMKNAFLSLFNYLSMLLVTVILKYYKKVVKNDISPVCMLSYSHFINMSVNHSIVSVQRIKCHFSTAIFRCITYITVAFN